MAAWLEGQCGGTLTFADFVSRYRKHPFEIEHIWANHPERHPEFRERAGLRRSAQPVRRLASATERLQRELWRQAIRGQARALLRAERARRSLHPKCYEHNPTFLRLRDERGLPFSLVPDEFTVDSFTAAPSAVPATVRTDLGSSELRNRGPGRLRATGCAGEQQRYYGVSLKNLLDAGLLRPGQRLSGTATE